MSTLNTNFENDFDTFFNIDDQTPISSSSDAKSLGPFASSSSQQTFSGPSYQYETFKQQTGLPMGGLATTLAVNQANGLHYRPGNHGFVMPTETLNLPLTNMDEFDFNRPQLDMTTEMDLEGESPTDMSAMFYAGGSQQQTPQRIYPGMHTQQAAQAKAQKQQEMMRHQQQPQQLPGQRPFPTQAPQVPKVPTAKDPHVEESISRLLSRMRQSSTASNSDDGEAPTTGMSNMPRMKKEEDDMDEDERLLNSEEGKKLSSKERRQLRNKVSARAFRSRRKEYITQLESEVAGKVQEANDLRVQNRQLMEENTRLTDLTRMLLSSQAFSGFLQELSVNGGNATANIAQLQRQQAAQQQQQQQQPQSVPKDVATHEAARKLSNQNQQMQVGMTLIPETSLEMFDNSAVWNAVPSTDYQVYAVTELPEPPKLDLNALTGKKRTSTPTSAKEAPVLPNVAVSEKFTVAEKIDDNVELDENDFSLFFHSEPAQMTTLNLPTTLTLHLSKVGLASELNTMFTHQQQEKDSWEMLKDMCSSIEEGCERLNGYLS